ncbi:hypothetical protein [Paenibacillus prosopidis]|uniref:Lipoprotein n=1 Tax=Paenibacillus prosopidis TaxID=630520 RepID=A0A368VR53_9BACL|nr:hypothetical protein [Paenibacillus prosopidis]RCW42436.1 hypothetical protein DFP97_117160 [Paenibacillus prosopidis]
MVKTQMIVLFLLVAMLTACGNDMKTTRKNINETQQVQRVVDPKVVTTTIENVEAIYVVQNDNNSVEIIVDGKLNTFRLDEMKDTDFKTLTKDDKVKISYTIKTEQVKDGEIKWSNLTKIEKVK